MRPEGGSVGMALATHWQLRRWLVVSSRGLLDGRWQKGLGGAYKNSFSLKCTRSNMQRCGTGLRHHFSLKRTLGHGAATQF